jgi:hypothetical protein
VYEGMGRRRRRREESSEILEGVVRGWLAAGPVVPRAAGAQGEAVGSVKRVFCRCRHRKET